MKVEEVLGLLKDRNYEITPFVNKIADRVITDNDTVVSYGIVKHFAEAIFAVEPRLSTKKKVESLRLLLDEAYYETRKVGIPELHVFTKDRAFANILAGHFEFKFISGIPLVKDLK